MEFVTCDQITMDIDNEGNLGENNRDGSENCHYVDANNINDANDTSFRDSSNYS